MLDPSPVPGQPAMIQERDLTRSRGAWISTVKIGSTNPNRSTGAAAAALPMVKSFVCPGVAQ